MERLAYTVAEACALARVGRTQLYRAIADGDLRAVKHRRSTRILASDLQAWIATWPDAKRAA